MFLEKFARIPLDDCPFWSHAQSKLPRCHEVCSGWVVDIYIWRRVNRSFVVAVYFVVCHLWGFFLVFKVLCLYNGAILIRSYAVRFAHPQIGLEIQDSYVCTNFLSARHSLKKWRHYIFSRRAALYMQWNCAIRFWCRATFFVVRLPCIPKPRGRYVCFLYLGTQVLDAWCEETSGKKRNEKINGREWK